jgi:hypothetical protein
MLRSDPHRAHLRPFASDHQCASECRKHVRALLATLTEIDHAYEVDLETVRTSDAPSTIKQAVIDTLRQKHQERRSAYLRELARLQKLSRTRHRHEALNGGRPRISALALS